MTQRRLCLKDFDHVIGQGSSADQIMSSPTGSFSFDAQSKLPLSLHCESQTFSSDVGLSC